MGQLETFRKLTKEQKVRFIWDYYRWHILAVILLISAISYTIYVKITVPTPVLNLVIIKTEAQTGEKEIDFSDFLTEYAYSDPVSVNRNLTLTGDLGTSYQSMQILHSYTFSGAADIFLWTEDTICQYFTKGITADVNDILSSETLQRDEITIFESDGTELEQPYSCFIKIENNAWAKENLGADDCYLSFSCSPLNPDAAKNFVEYLLSGSEI